MNELKDAIRRLEGRFGKIDNVKLLLDGGPAVTKEKVAADFRAIATAVLKADPSMAPDLSEPGLDALRIG